MWKKDLNLTKADCNFLNNKHLKPNGYKTKKPPKTGRFLVGPQGLEP